MGKFLLPIEWPAEVNHKAGRARRVDLSVGTPAEK